MTKERSLDVSLLTLGDSLSWILLKQEVSPYNLYEFYFSFTFMAKSFPSPLPEKNISL